MLCATHDSISADRGVTLNGVKIGEIGLGLALFTRARLWAAAAEEAAVGEGRALCPNAVGITVKSVERNWLPRASETRSLIREGVLDALRRHDQAEGLHFDPPFRFTLSPTDGHRFDPSKRIPFRWLARRIFFGLSNGRLDEVEASWETTIIRGLYALECARLLMSKRA